MIHHDIVSRVETYFHSLPNDVFPDGLKSRATVVLSGSTGWGITEGFDEKADWDLHILLGNEAYQSFIIEHGANYVIDDHGNSPIVFGQINGQEWLMERVEGNRSGSWPLYLWIYKNCVFIQDPLSISSLIEKYQLKFERELDQLRRDHFVLFSVRRLDTSSSAKREIVTAAGINRGEMVKVALQTFSLIHGKPYPYNKWLAKHVERLCPEGEKLVELCNNCLMETRLEVLIGLAKELRNMMEEEMRKITGEQRWISHWWEFNKN
ncbi:hypothetical protein [Baia soyae]|uniref:Nucleotidyltransferase-like protein n=1 Tax=Baia soyae TaxID=1544746 RepID=A0A4R2RLM7_9BACL|nr:hypothetical protein [Baia soyae]TCP64033.1 hypothetical protein EDD57_14421 [Baia soyae]